MNENNEKVLTSTGWLPVSRVRCARCGRRALNLTDWNMEMRQGVAIYFLCPRCQTPEENAEAARNESTLDYNRDAFGRVRATPVGMPRDAESLSHDLYDRTEAGFWEMMHVVVDSGVTLDIRDIAEHVERSLPRGYPRFAPEAPKSMRDVIIEMIRDIRARLDEPDTP